MSFWKLKESYWSTREITKIGQGKKKLKMNFTPLLTCEIQPSNSGRSKWWLLNYATSIQLRLRAICTKCLGFSERRFLLFDPIHENQVSNVVVQPQCISQTLWVQGPPTEFFRSPFSRIPCACHMGDTCFSFPGRATWLNSLTTPLPLLIDKI